MKPEIVPPFKSIINMLLKFHAKRDNNNLKALGEHEQQNADNL